ncbi:MAG TPA: MurR/RpiR family transcriptional regulator [Devosia sp.]|nr:MurR/RpiR family transcriptional regulator [Devosia sp.]
MDILGTLQNQMEEFSRSELRIADILFTDTEFATNASITELAQRAEVSPPTVTRFCRRLGCQSYSEFKVRLAQTTFVGTRYLTPETPLLSADEVVEDIVTRAQKALHSLHHSTNISDLQEIAKRICDTGMIYAFGSGGNSSMVASEFQNRLFRFGLRVTASSDHTMQLMMASAANPDDIIIASSISGRNEELVRALKVARDYKVFTVALTRPGSPLAEMADITLPIDLREGLNILKPTAVRFVFLAMVDIIATLVAMQVEGGAQEKLRRIKYQVVAHRDNDDSEPLGD